MEEIAARTRVRRSFPREIDWELRMRCRVGEVVVRRTGVLLRGRSTALSARHLLLLLLLWIRLRV